MTFSQLSSLLVWTERDRIPMMDDSVSKGERKFYQQVLENFVTAHFKQVCIYAMKTARVCYR